MSDDLQEEFHSAVLHENMKISSIMVHAQQMEEARAKMNIKDVKRERSFDGGSSNSCIEIQDKHKLRRGFLMNFLLCSLRQRMIVCITLRFKREGILVHQQRSQLVETMGRSTMVIVLME